MTSFIGDYVHYFKRDYLQYSTTQNTLTSFDPNAVLEEQAKEIKRMLEERYKHRALNLEGIENQLNFYFRGINQDATLQNNMTPQQFQQVHNIIMKKIDAGVVQINPFTLASAINKGGIDVVALKTQVEYRKNKIKSIENVAANILEREQNAKADSSVQQSTIENSIKFICSAIEATNSDNLRPQLALLEQEWSKLQSMTPGKLYSRQDQQTKNVLTLITEMVGNFKVGSSTLHGTYAEYIIEFTNLLAQNKATKTFAETIEEFSQNLSDAAKKTKGQLTSRKALVGANFSHDFVDLGIVVDNNVRWRLDDDKHGNYIYATGTQDKVDVDIMFEDLKIPASVKNYNFNNPVRDMHFLEGRSILVLLQDKPDLLNHYLNIAAPHGDANFDNRLIGKSSEVMKLAILLKALAGGIYALDGSGTINPSEQAEIIVINDNSQGKFRVFSVAWILDKVERKINSLVKTGDFDTLRLRNDWVGGAAANKKNAKARITNLLKQLHNAKVSVSIDKGVFLDKDGNF